MAKIFTLIALLLQLCTMIQGPDLCNEFFTYIPVRKTNEIMVQIEIPSPPRVDRYHLKVGFNTDHLIHKETITELNANKSTKAIREELPAHELNETWTPVRRQKCVRGFQQHFWTDYMETFAPVARCEDTKYKCCSDGRTPAKGPNFVGCTCDASQYGCCPNGIEEAQGENFEGCVTKPSMLVTTCSLKKDRGSCRDFTVKWYHDTDIGCSRFWYGGCEGNENRFETQEECKEVCVQPKGKAVCFLPKFAGPCEGHNPMWYYDASRKQCDQFVYSGCIGNANKFTTKGECEELCVTPDDTNPCDQPKEAGPCAGNFTKWYFNRESQTCEQFVYGGCKANDNNFPTEIACHQRCLQSDRRKEQDICLLPAFLGECYNYTNRWFYDSHDGVCKQFLYSGCQSNGNNFNTREECECCCGEVQDPCILLEIVPVARLEKVQPAIQTSQQGRPLLYHVHFPVAQAIPRLTEIWLNDQKLCSNTEKENVTTTVEVEHVYPSREEPPSANGLSHQNGWTIEQESSTSVTENTSPTTDLSTDINSFTMRVPNVPTPKPVQYNECGIRIDAYRSNFLINNGEETRPGQWPWLVALFALRIDHEFKCAGSVLTNSHVLTAAHCLKLSSTNNDTLHPNVLVVALGRFKLRQWRETGTVNREVISYKIHPDYVHTENGDSDLAILTLRTAVEFSPFIRPICLWSGSTDLQNVVNRTGFVVGWGEDELGRSYTEEPRLARVPIVSQETCLWNHQVFFSLTSKRTFCGGLLDHSGPCNGDSGSGLVLFDAATNRYQLRGVVSRSLSGIIPSCDLQHYVVYVDVAKYTSWIQEQISTT